VVRHAVCCQPRLICRIQRPHRDSRPALRLTAASKGVAAMSRDLRLRAQTTAGDCSRRGTPFLTRFSLRHIALWCGCVSLGLAVAGCGGGGDGRTTTKKSATAEAAADIAELGAAELSVASAAHTIVLSEPTHVFGTSRIALSWSARGAGALTFSVLVK